MYDKLKPIVWNRAMQQAARLRWEREMAMNEQARNGVAKELRTQLLTSMTAKNDFNVHVKFEAFIYECMRHM